MSYDDYLLLYICIGPKIETMLVHQSIDVNNIKTAILTLFFRSYEVTDITIDVENLYDEQYIKVLDIKYR